MAKKVLNCDFTVSKPNEKWVTDITYVETHGDWLFVVAITDLFSRKVSHLFDLLFDLVQFVAGLDDWHKIVKLAAHKTPIFLRHDFTFD